MAKNNEDNAEQALKDLLKQLGNAIPHQAPEGFVKQTGDIVGFWVPVTPIMGIARSAKLMDNTQDESKSSALVLVELNAPCIVQEAEGDGYRIASTGEQVGLWYKPGMRGLRWLGGQVFWMMLEPEEKWKDTGKANPMMTYDLQSERRGTGLLIDADYRSKSKPKVDREGKILGLHDLEAVPSVGLTRPPSRTAPVNRDTTDDGTEPF